MHQTFTATYFNASATKLFFTLSLLVLPLLGLGQTFSGTYPFTNVTSSTGTTDPTLAPSATGVTFGSFAAVGTSANPSAGSRFTFTGWPTGATDGSDTFTGAVDAGKYYTVALTPQAGFVLSISNITFTLQRTSTGVRQYAVRSSADNYTTNLPASISSANTTLSVVASNVFQVTDAATTAQTGSTITLGGTGYTNVSSPITFRFYGFNAEAASSGSFSIDDVKISGVATATNAPTVSNFTPTSGPAGTNVTITGAYFTASTSVAFNGVAASSVVITNTTTLTATVPSGASTGPIAVTTSGGTATSAAPFTVTVPTVTVSPASLSGFAAAAGTASAAQTYQVSGNALDGNTLAINVSTTNFEVSLDGRSYGSSASIALGGSTTLAASTVYVRLASGAPLGSASATIANTNGAVTTNLAASGVVVTPLVAKRWTGAAGTTSWFDAANWENGSVPASTDDVVLDHRYVTGKYTVNLGNSATVPPSAVTVSSLRIRPAAGDSILCVIPLTNTISTSANNAPALALSRTVAGDTALYIATKGAFINVSGAAAGDVFDPAGTSPTVFLLNGGSFYHRTVRSNTTLVENLSGAAGTETGNFFFRIPGFSTTISGSARTYGNLIFQRGGASSYGTSGGNTFTINGNLTIESGVTFLVTINGTTVLKGNLANAGNFQLKAATATATGRRLVLQGTAPQVLAGTSLGDPASATSYLGPDAQLEINNAAGVTLQTPVTLSSGLALTSGLLSTTTSNMLTMLPTATVTGGSASSFVNGTVARLVPSVANGTGIYTSYTFPVGKGSSYHPIVLNVNTQTSTTTYRAEQFEGDPGQNVTGSDLARVSKANWFTITPFSGATPTQPSGFSGTISIPFASSDGVTDPTATTLVVAKRADATQPWTNIGRSGASASTLTSATFTSFSEFALASTSADASANPLPVTLTSFNATRQANGTVKIDWATASEQRSAYFEIQRSLDGRLFTSGATVPANGTTTQAHYYSRLDNAAPACQLYYRLRQVDTNNTATYSPVVTLAGSASTLDLYPNPAHDQLVIALAAGRTVQLFDLAGYLVQTATLPASGQLSVSSLPAGTYLLRIVLPEQTRTLRFTKQ
ncbi:T9SS type A sorting domain-containing protein [Hymenobacter setariae]|uniref:T9SS type A sorting domain-containing protein n=1 Tax=Hymenobacter setariae TaxID=2594794 RepID=A0A558C4X1_9BACT|nr:T9SS type A sorting domain-containing protein [Hymenobacter setariae]TVT43682.1 T9SS type A sorting domain-containing protein [Hymenobacter setariae]